MIQIQIQWKRKISHVLVKNKGVLSYLNNDVRMLVESRHSSEAALQKSSLLGTGVCLDCFVCLFVFLLLRTNSHKIWAPVNQQLSSDFIFFLNKNWVFWSLVVGSAATCSARYWARCHKIWFWKQKMKSARNCHLASFLEAEDEKRTRTVWTNCWRETKQQQRLRILF